MNKRVFIVTFFSFFVMANCQQPSASKSETPLKPEKKAIPPQSSKTDKKPSKKLIPLTDENLVEELTKYGNENRETLVVMKTPKGVMKIQLYENTPLHRANFIRLIKNGFYNGTEFYRVINHFMIQGGDSDGFERQYVKQKMGTYTLPAEFRKENIHKKGALSMAREYENNPEKRSVAFEFFIIQGTRYTAGELLGAEQQYHLFISPVHQEIYKTQGGTPHLDGQHTVFGQVIEGLEIIDSLAAVSVDEGNWPIEKMSIGLEIIE
ncbi:MAG: peptidylprolyl isomerase [Salinivirgaceae bacterium]|nr:peptidylprolyl isomerase [Salinivirgaceae bacterium]